MMSLLLPLWFSLVGASPGANSPQVVQDCASCPRMIVIPAGTYSVGSPNDEPGRYPNEPSMEPVAVARFAVAEAEITRGQFAEFVSDTNHDMSGGCYTPGKLDDLLSDLDPEANWRSPGFEQTDEHPVVCVSWNDASAFADWLSRRTGQNYQLPNELSWEVAARGGTVTPYFWGKAVGSGCGEMNGGDLSLSEKWPEWAERTELTRQSIEPNAVIIQCRDGFAFTSPHRSFRPNAFGLFDMTGNVWEWVLDCGDEQKIVESSRGATAGLECQRRRTRGGSWNDWPVDLRSSVRKRLEPSYRRNDTGFRLVRIFP